MDIARDDDLGDHRLHMALDEPAQRTGAIDGIIAILDNIGDTVEVEKIVRPIYNFKAGGE